MSTSPQTVPLSDGRGVVTSFDDPRGIGVIRRDDGTEYPFHCTAIFDGTRTIHDGATVSFSVAPGRMGRWEAIRIATVGD
jgi:cold shock CspA family protein